MEHLPFNDWGFQRLQAQNAELNTKLAALVSALKGHSEGAALLEGRVDALEAAAAELSSHKTPPPQA